jgi:RNA polymerase sigma-70 factor (ECF subfamily)
VRQFESTLRAAQRGDDEAFALLWRSFQPGLLRYLTVKCASEAEDLSADIWLKVARALPSFDGNEQGFRSWLFTTARNRLTDWYRGSERRPGYVDDSALALIPSPDMVEVEVGERSGTDAAVTMIATLPPDQAEAIMLRVVVGLDVGRVAHIMGRSPGSVRVLCHRGLKRLERQLDEQDTTPTPIAAGAPPPVMVRAPIPDPVHAPPPMPDRPSDSPAVPTASRPSARPLVRVPADSRDDDTEVRLHA